MLGFSGACQWERFPAGGGESMKPKMAGSWMWFVNWDLMTIQILLTNCHFVLQIQLKSLN